MGFNSQSLFSSFSLSESLDLTPKNHLALLLVRCLLFPKGFQRGECYGFYFMSHPILLKQFSKKRKFRLSAFPYLLHISFRFFFQLHTDIMCVFITVLSFSLSPSFSTQLSLKICLCLPLAQSGSSEYQRLLLISHFHLFCYFHSHSDTQPNISIVACSALCHSRPA